MVDGAVVLVGDVVVDGAVVLVGDVVVDGAVVLVGDVVVDGAVVLVGDVVVDGAVVLVGDVVVDGAVLGVVVVGSGAVVSGDTDVAGADRELSSALLSESPPQLDISRITPNSQAVLFQNDRGVTIKLMAARLRDSSVDRGRSPL